MTHRVLLSKNTATGAASRGFPFPRKLANSRGQVFYGMHFYPGVAEYPFGRVFVNENTIRAMGPTFAGCPVYVDHVDDVPDNIDEARVDCDGVVVESFFNAADGKHWVKFIVQSERGLKAIKEGYRLSNCYEPTGFAQGGLWNGVSYNREVTGAKYEHLALVRDPRYDESEVLTPEQFKAYNERHTQELTRLANEKDKKGGSPVPKKLQLFKRTKIENAADLENTVVVLEKSGREMTIEQLANAADEMAMKEKGPCVANGDHMVNYGGKDMTVNDLLAAHKMANDELTTLRAAGDKDTDDDMKAPGGEVDHVMENEDDESPDDESMENEDDEKEEKESKAKAKADDKEEKAEKTKNAAEAKAKAKEKAEKLRNAHRGPAEAAPAPRLPADRVARGRDLFGS